MRALITGVGGQDGTLMARRLLADDWDVHGTIRSSAPEDQPITEGVVVHDLDLRDVSRIGPLLERVRPDAVFNLGGISSVAESWRVPALTGSVNAIAVAQLLESALHLNDAGHHVRVVQASSAEMFGDATDVPQSVSTPLAPSSPYGASKAFAHSMVGAYRRRGLHASSAILFNHESTLRPIEFVTRKITRGVASIALGLSDSIRLGNLDARRDWSWADDVVGGMVSMVRSERPGDFVLASGVSHSVADFVGAAFAAVGIADWARHVVIDEALVRPGDAVEQRGDIGPARRELGWAPSVGFEELVRRMVESDLESMSDPGEKTIS